MNFNCSTSFSYSDQCNFQILVFFIRNGPFGCFMNLRGQIHQNPGFPFCDSITESRMDQKAPESTRKSNMKRSLRKSTCSGKATGQTFRIYSDILKLARQTGSIPARNFATLLSENTKPGAEFSFRRFSDQCGIYTTGVPWGEK